MLPKNALQLFTNSMMLLYTMYLQHHTLLPSSLATFSSSVGPSHPRLHPQSHLWFDSSMHIGLLVELEVLFCSAEKSFVARHMRQNLFGCAQRCSSTFAQNNS